MQSVILIWLLAFIPLEVWSMSKAPKYKKGDCITPTDYSYTWYGRCAKVQAFSSVEGFTDKSYILSL